VQQLRDLVATRPEDLQGHRLLAMSEGRLGNFDAAHRLQARVIELLGDAAEPEDYLILADFMINAAWGYVSPEAEGALEQVLRRDPTNAMARYFYGIMFAQNDRPDLAFQLWRQVLNESEPGAPWVAPIRGQIEFMAMRAGVEYTLPPENAPRGPSAADIAAAMELDPEARIAMIEGMVAQLSSRLASEGGTAEDWARLIAAYGVMGATEDASAIWTEAQVVFGTRPDALATVRAAAQAAGVAE
jgi:cytochrome c-type biogenesis protein CcmH